MAFEPGRAVEAQVIHTTARVSCEGLPPAVAERFYAILDRAETLHAAMPPFEQRHELATERVKATQRLQQLEAHPSFGGFGLGPDDPRVCQQKALIAELTASKERMEARYRRTSEVWQAASKVRTAVEQWLRERPPTTVEDAPTEPPKLLKNESLLEGIERYRRRARELVADLRRIEAAPYPRDYCRQKATDEVLALAERGRINASHLVEHDGSLVFPTMQLSSRVYNVEARGAVAFANDVPDILGIFATIHTDAMIAAACKAVDEEYDGGDDSGALSHEERERRAAELEGDLLDIERQESALVRAALAQALPCEHRADCNVQAILQCRLITLPPREGGSSPEHASYSLIGGQR
jgi:hypothetical protein